MAFCGSDMKASLDARLVVSFLKVAQEDFSSSLNGSGYFPSSKSLPVGNVVCKFVSALFITQLQVQVKKITTLSHVSAFA